MTNTLLSDVLAALRAVLGADYAAATTDVLKTPPGALKFLPLAGLLAGLIAVPVLFAGAVTLPQPVPVILACATLVFVTRVRSERGLAEAADAVFGGAWQRSDDVQSGGRPGGDFGSLLQAPGVAAVAFVLALKLSALAALDFAAAAGAILGGMAASRAVHVLALRRMDVSQATRARVADVAVALALGLTPGIVLLSPATWMNALGLAVLVTAVLSLIVVKTVGRVSPNVPSALEQIFETAYYLGAAAAIAGPG